MTRRGGWWLGLWVGMAAAGVAGAQPAPTRADDPARLSFEHGMAALQANRPADAVREFEDSYRRRPVAVVQYNLALAYRALGRNVDAVLAFERFLREPGGVAEAQLRAVRRELEALRAGLAQVQVTVSPANATVIVDGLPAAIDGGTLLLEPGAHEVEFDAPGLLTQRRSGTFVRGSRDRWNIALSASAATSRSPYGGETRSAPTVPVVVPTRVDDGRDRQRVGLETVRPREGGAEVRPTETGRPGWVVPVVVVASVAVAAGIGVGVWALLREPGVELPATTTGWTVETIRVGP